MQTFPSLSIGEDWVSIFIWLTFLDPKNEQISSAFTNKNDLLEHFQTRSE